MISSSEQERGIGPWRVIAVFALFVYIAAWLLVALVTKDIWVNNVLRPYLPNWALLVIAFSAPITAALMGLDSVPWKISVAFIFVASIQGSMFGLVGEKYPHVQAALTLFLFLEAYLILPKLNRRSLRLKEDGTILHLK